MDGEKQEQDSNSRIAAATFTDTSAAVTVATVCPGNSACTRAPSSSLSIISPDRQAVQVIQHAIQRPPNMAAQFLQQMYAAQQQHLMLQTAALQQHQRSPHLQSLATMHQASACQRQSTSSSGSRLIHHQAPGVSIALPASPVTAQLVGRTQNSVSSGVSTTISQQAMLLGGRPANYNQAQMYLRTQMLILTPAASVAAVQSDLPAVTSCSPASSSSQVQNLVLHHLPGALTTANSVILKPPPQCPALAPADPKASGCSLKSSQMTESSSERGQPAFAGSQVLTPAVSPAQTLFKQQQLPCPPGHQGAHRQLILGAAVIPSQSGPGVQSQAASPASSSPLPSSASAQTTVPAARVQPQPPPLTAAPQRRWSVPQTQAQTIHPPPPPPPLVLPRFSQNPSSTLQRLSLHSVQALTIQSRQVVLKEQEPPATEGLDQTAYHNLPPPQTVAVDLKVQPAHRSGTPSSGQACKGNILSPSEEKDEPPHLSPPFPGSRMQNGAAVDPSPSLSSHTAIRPPAPPSPPQPPHALPAAVTCPSHSPSSSGSPNGPLPTHVLTHLVEGFVIQEGTESFPVVPSSLLTKTQASLPDSQETETNQDAAADERPLVATRSDSSDSEMGNNGPAVDEQGESVGGVLRCEYCGGRGHERAFLGSSRFCSVTCIRRFSKHVALLRAGRWGHRVTGRGGRPPSRVNGASKEHFLKRVFRSGRAREQEEEDEDPAPMTTRLRKHAERQREKEREKESQQEGLMTETISISDEEDDRCPSHWDVDRVFSYINSLPGGEGVAEVFRSQEIDGQALLLLTEDHLISTMNLKLGPALKLCARINSLKDA